MERSSQLERLTQLNHSVAPVAFAQDRIIPVTPVLESLFPEGGLTRGQIIGCRGTAALSLAFATVARASVGGSWVAAVGLATLGAQAASEAGIALERLVMITLPVGITETVWANTVSALIDGFDVVVMRQSSLCPIRAGTARRLQARLQARGAIFVLVGQPGEFSVDVALSTTAGEWEGLGNGSGRLVRRQLTVSASGRRVPQTRRTAVWLPGTQGGIEAVADTVALVVAPLAVAPLAVAPLQQAG
jgi:hypothetical protein